MPGNGANALRKGGARGFPLGRLVVNSHVPYRRRIDQDVSSMLRNRSAYRSRTARPLSSKWIAGRRCEENLISSISAARNSSAETFCSTSRRFWRVRSEVKPGRCSRTRRDDRRYNAGYRNQDVAAATGRKSSPRRASRRQSSARCGGARPTSQS